MNSISSRIKGRGKSLIERTFGLHITRMLPPLPNKHADADIRSLRNWSSQDVVFDVGANDGRTVLRIQDQLCSPRIFAFEPVSSTYQTLVERTRHLGNVHCFQLAMGAKSGREEIYLHEVAAMNSFSPQWAPNTGTEVVDVATVDQVMAEQGVEFIHFLKIDTEGYEMEVLHGAKNALSSARVALLQVEAGFGQMQKELTHLDEVRCFLAPMGYFLYGIYNQCRTGARVPEGFADTEVNGYDPKVLAYCDALFIRADLER